MNEIKKMQDNLLLIRRIVGWTAEEFGEKIGLTRQTINNIESGRNKLSKTQYIAMRSVLDAEIIKHPEDTEMLKIFLDVFIDNSDKYSEKAKKDLLEKFNLISPSILAKTTTREVASNELLKYSKLILGSIAIGGIVGATSILSKKLFNIDSSWINKIIGNSNNMKGGK